MTKTNLNYNLNVNEDFVMVYRLKFQTLTYLFIGSAHINWILDLEGEVHSIWDL